MNFQICLAFIVICLLGALNGFRQDSQLLHISNDSAQQIGYQIWKNECRGKKEGLTTWNKGEDFASLGIGHFIWYPENKEGVFKQTFPDLLIFFKEHQVQLPDWLEQAKGCPWQTREEFEKDQQNEKLKTLRQFLTDHIDLQILFMLKRLHQALPTLLKNTPASKHAHLTRQFYRLAYSKNGVYALLDYLNFKGEGVSIQESYQGHRWGLLQVLENMPDDGNQELIVQEFVDSAKKVLASRVEHALPERHEEKWLKGWYNRIETYSRLKFN